jgi:tetratricopeptide (TPR) repeat protein
MHLSRCPGLLFPILLLAGAEGLAAEVRFVGASAEAGIALQVESGAVGKPTILSTTGSGACFLDFDLDGDLDLYVVNGATEADVGPDNPARNALYENLGRGRSGAPAFREIGALAGVDDNGWGGGCAVADYDNDGDPDVYVTNYGVNRLYRNLGPGAGESVGDAGVAPTPLRAVFEEVAAAAGVDVPGWSSGATFVDLDRDGWLDLYVAGYLDFASLPRDQRIGCRFKGGPVSCGPRGFAAEPDRVFRNLGGGRFEDVSASSGLDRLAPRYALGVVAGDLDGDGGPELVVANDSQENLLLAWDGGRLVDLAFEAGVALAGDGRAQAGMGVDLGDYDGDGDEDLLVTNFSDDHHTLYRNDGDLLFTDVSAAAGFDPASRSSLGWAGLFFDHDNDGDLDVVVAGGHVYPGVEGFDPSTSYRQRNLLFENHGGRYREVGDAAGPGFAEVKSSRGIALGDYDDDGDLDLVVVEDDDAPSLLRNDGGNSAHWLKLRLVGRRSNRDGIGARLRLMAAGKRQVREMRLTAGYYSSHDPRLHFGLGTAERVDELEVLWPSGVRQTFSGLPADRLATIDEVDGLVALDELVARSPAGATPASPAPSPSPEVASGTAPGESPPGQEVRPEGPPEPLTEAAHREIVRRVQAGTRQILAGRYDQAIGIYREALARLPSWKAAAASPDALGFGDPQSYRLYLSGLWDNLGVALMRAGRLDRCAAPIEQAIAILPERGKYHRNLGLCHFHGRRYDRAAAALERAFVLDPESPGLSYDLGRILALADRCEAAEPPLLRTVEELPPGDPRGRAAEAWYLLGVCRAQGGRHQQAADAFREALALVPGHQPALFRLGAVLRRAGKTAAARRIDELFAARRPREEEARARQLSGAASVSRRLELARAYLEAGLAPDALQEAETAAVAAPSEPAAGVLMGQAAMALRPPRLDLAERFFGRALALAEPPVAAFVGLAEIRRRRGDPAAARGPLATALELEPGHPGARIEAARQALAAGDRPQAEEGLRQVLADDPENAAARRALAEVLLDAGDRASEVLVLLERDADLYGEAVPLRVRSLARAGREDEARRLVEESPFLGAAERRALEESLFP